MKPGGMDEMGPIDDEMLECWESSEDDGEIVGDGG